MIQYLRRGAAKGLGERGLFARNPTMNLLPASFAPISRPATPDLPRSPPLPVLMSGMREIDAQIREAGAGAAGSERRLSFDCQDAEEREGALIEWVVRESAWTILHFLYK